MAKAGKITATALDAVRKAVRPGVTTLELDEIAKDVIRSFMRRHFTTTTDLGQHYEPRSTTNRARLFVLGRTLESGRYRQLTSADV